MTVSKSRLGIRGLVLTAMLLSCGQALGQDQKPTEPQTAGPEQAEYTFKATTRLVEVDVVARDDHNRPVRDLTTADFQVSEKLGLLKESQQKISAFRFVDGTASRAPTETPIAFVPTGVYTNVVATHELSVPPTVLLIDALNTDLAPESIEIRQKLLRMTDSIPENVPVAVFLLGAQPQIIQNFTTDPKALRQAVEKSLGLHLNTIEFSNRPDIISPDVQKMFGSPVVNMAQITPQKDLGAGDDYLSYMDRRVKGTTDGFQALARYLAGYPGRKNLIWVSESFPFSMLPNASRGQSHQFDGVRSYYEQVRSITRALADAQVSVYPVDVQGIWTLEGWSAQDKAAPPIGTGSTFIADQFRDHFALESTEQQVADRTGGKACIANNDPGDCVKKAFDDGLSYYEIAYYPSPETWKEGFHEISVKTSRPGIHLSFRRSYLVNPPAAVADRTRRTADDKTIVDPELKESACKDGLTSTSLPVRVQAIPADNAARVKYLLTVDGKKLSFTPEQHHMQKLRLDFALCEFDATGDAVQYMQDDIDQTLDPGEFQSVIKNGFPHLLEFTPPGRVAQLRLVARDVGSGLLGSVDLQLTTSDPRVVRANRAQETPLATADVPPSFGTTIADPAALRGKVYELEPTTTHLPEFSKMQSIGTIYTPVLNVPEHPFTEGIPGVTDRTDWIGIDYQGTFWVDKPANYEFLLISDDGARLYIDERLVVDNDGLHEAQSKDGATQLDRGEHTIRVSYFQGLPFEAALALYMKAPGQEYRLFDTRLGRPPEKEDQHDRIRLQLPGLTENAEPPLSRRATEPPVPGP